MKKTLLVFAAMGFCLLSAPAFALIEVEGFYWLMQPAGDVSFGGEGEEGTGLDLEGDLGFDSAERIPGFKLAIGDVHQIGIGYFSMDIEADSIMTENVRFGDAVFYEGTDVTSTWEGDIVQGFYRLNLGSSSARYGLLAGGMFIDFTAAMESEWGRSSQSSKAIMPYVGGYFMGYPVSWGGVRGSVLASTWDWGDVSATMLDIELAGEVVFTPGVYVAAGYRHTGIDATFEDDNVDIDVTFSGPIAYLGFEW
ncbi:MAG: hypothetical protein AB7T27_02120 [Kiritimatiellia bacterium]